MQKKTLAIMAAGFGSRFGGIKQLYSFTSNDYSLLDFSIYDAIQVGFNHIIFIVREDILTDFKEKYDFKLPNHITVNYVIQQIEYVPDTYKSIKRKTPWGTGHALLILKQLVKNKFAIINADDFYTKDAFKKMHENLFIINDTQNFLIGYQLDKTLSENGSVSRGECVFDADNSLNQIIERKEIIKKHDLITYIENNKTKTIKKTSIVSMNFWGFNPDILEIAENEFYLFLGNYKNDASEFYITKVVEKAIGNKQEFKIINTDSEWFGITYKEDSEIVSEKIKTLISKGIYPEKLW